MKKITFLLCALGTLSSAYATVDNVCQGNSSNLHCSSGTIENLKFRGIVDIEGTTVTNLVNIIGELHASKAHLNRAYVVGNSYLTSTIIKDVEVIGNVHSNDLNIMGSTKIVGQFNGENSIFHSDTKIVGAINCKACIFKTPVTFIGESVFRNSTLENLFLSTHHSEFYGSKVNDIRVKKPNDGHDQIITISENSIVHDVYFESQKGTIYLSRDSKITGSIQGGNIITK